MKHTSMFSPHCTEPLRTLRSLTACKHLHCAMKQKCGRLYTVTFIEHWIGLGVSVLNVCVMWTAHCGLACLTICLCSHHTSYLWGLVRDASVPSFVKLPLSVQWGHLKRLDVMGLKPLGKLPRIQHCVARLLQLWKDTQVWNTGSPRAGVVIELRCLGKQK